MDQPLCHSSSCEDIDMVSVLYVMFFNKVRALSANTMIHDRALTANG